MKIIDAHTHPRFSTPWEDPVLLKQSTLAPEEVVRQSRMVGIDRMVVLGNIIRFGFNPDAEQMRTINECTEELVERFPDFFIGFCYLNPLLPKAELEAEANRFFSEGNFRAIKLECDCCASDKRMGPLMEIAEQYNVPVLQHAWDTKDRERKKVPGKMDTDGEDVAELARRHPRVRIQMAHLTGVGIRGVEAIRNCENVWVDTSGSLPFSQRTEYAVRRLGIDRVIYGSDFPIRDIAGSLSKVLSGPFSEEDKGKLLSGNFCAMMDREFPGL